MEWTAWWKVTGLLCDRKVPAKLKGGIYKIMARLAILYGMEAVEVTKGQERKMDVKEMRVLRFALGKTGMDKIQNGTIRETTGVDEIVNKLRECRLKWLGHVECRWDGYIGKRVRRTTAGQRKMGRPSRRWKVCIREGMMAVGVTKEDA